MTSREPRLFALFGFATTHDALAAESLLKAEGVRVVPVPAPRILGSLCGIALRLEKEDARRARLALGSAGIGVSTEIDLRDV